MDCCGGAAALDAVITGDVDGVMARELAGRPASINSIPLYDDFYEHSDRYSRIQIHLIGVVGGGSNSSKTAIAQRKNRFGWNRIADGVADPYVTVKVTGDDDAAIGSTDYFDIAQHTFPVLLDSTRPVWDAKTTLLAKTSGIQSLQFRMLDKNKGEDELLLGFDLPVSELPEPTTDTLENPGQWTKFIRSSNSKSSSNDEEKEEEPVELVFLLKIVNASERVVNEQDTKALTQDTEDMSYSEHVIAPPNSTTNSVEDNALLQCWKHNKEPTTQAVFWVVGRNDCFMHPHVAKALFWNSDSEKKYDLYVLNYSMNGACRQQGWVSDAHMNSHNKYGTFDVYTDQIDAALNIIKNDASGYNTLLGYAHSTGGPVLLNYIMEKGDDDFDGFLFNSPFLDWGFVGGDLVEVVLENVGLLERLGMASNDQKFGAAVTPDALKKTPIKYLGEEVVMCPWSAKVWSQYHFDWSRRPLYKVPMTAGFAKGVTGVHTKMKDDFYKKKKAITSKPFLCITSRGDDVLKSSETNSRADWIGPSRCEIELNDNAHDVFLSQDVNDTLMALDMAKSWMKNKGFL